MDKCTVFLLERLRCEARAFFFIANYPYFAKCVLNGKNSSIFAKNSGKNLRISKNVCTFALEKQTNKQNIWIRV